MQLYTQAAQRLQQEGLGLVATVVREQHRVAACGPRHACQRGIAPGARPGLDAFAAARPSRQPFAAAGDAARAAAAFDEALPVVGRGGSVAMQSIRTS